MTAPGPAPPPPSRPLPRREFTGLLADLVLFHPREIRDLATLEAPRRRAAGVRATFVNGTPVTWNGRFTGAQPGEILRRG